MRIVFIFGGAKQVSWHGYEVNVHFETRLDFRQISMILSFIVIVEFYYIDWSANHAHIVQALHNTNAGNHCLSKAVTK